MATSSKQVHWLLAWLASMRAGRLRACSAVLQPGIKVMMVVLNWFVVECDLQSKAQFSLTYHHDVGMGDVPSQPAPEASQQPVHASLALGVSSTMPGFLSWS